MTTQPSSCFPLSRVKLACIWLNQRVLLRQMCQPFSPSTAQVSNVFVLSTLLTLSTLFHVGSCRFSFSQIHEFIYEYACLLFRFGQKYKKFYRKSILHLVGKFTRIDNWYRYFLFYSPWILNSWILNKHMAESIEISSF